MKERMEALRMGENAFSDRSGCVPEYVEEDRACYRLEVRPEHLNPYGMVHGGALYTMADDAGGAAAVSRGKRYVTQHGGLHFLQNQGAGVLRAEAHVRRRGRRTCLVAVDITNEAGELLASGEFTYFCIDAE